MAQPAGTWRRTLVVMMIANGVATMGFLAMLPFLPFFLAELGVKGVEAIGVWSGLVITGKAIATALMAPIWGSLADRFGRKLMVQRAMLGGALVIGLMALVQTPEQLLALRVAQGAVTGIVSAANAHVAAQTPPARRGMALAMLQLSGFVGTTSGPLLGGLMAAHFGYRSVFLITAALLLGAGLLVWIVVREEKVLETTPDTPIVHHILTGLKTVLQTPVLNQLYSIRMLATIGIFMVSPFMPLVVQNLIGSDGDPVVFTGIVEGVTAAVGAVAAVWAGGWMVVRIGYRRMLVLTALLAAASYGLQGLAHTVWALLLFRVLGGAATGSLLVTATTFQAQLVPRNRYGAAYAVDSSIISGANALGPMLGAYCAITLGLPTVFWASALVFMITIWLAHYISEPARLVNQPPPLLENGGTGKNL